MVVLSHKSRKSRHFEFAVSIHTVRSFKFNLKVGVEELIVNASLV
jgi:hypothetical protein